MAAARDSGLPPLEQPLGFCLGRNQQRVAANDMRQAKLASVRRKPLSSVILRRVMVTGAVASTFAFVKASRSTVIMI